VARITKRHHIKVMRYVVAKMVVVIVAVLARCPYMPTINTRESVLMRFPAMLDFHVNAMPCLRFVTVNRRLWQWAVTNRRPFLNVS
jgi:glutathione peroxidase-family protein